MWINVYEVVDTMTDAEKRVWMWDVYMVKSRRPVTVMLHPMIKQLVSKNV